jgi:hypothetical protein
MALSRAPHGIRLQAGFVHALTMLADQGSEICSIWVTFPSPVACGHPQRFRNCRISSRRKDVVVSRKCLSSLKCYTEQTSLRQERIVIATAVLN